MGRWSQRRLAGGGPTSLNYMNLAHAVSDFIVNISFAENVSTDQFDTGAFESHPSNVNDWTYVQTGPRSIQATTAFSIAGDDEIQYVQNSPGFRSNQILQYE